ncbi:unnamed protein product [Ranitomeya imitator]|uniref:SOCS box domain-containing protein n=1 Tax=Ranitomeya imitator TaxID=111125 RepID=A0ABN9MJT3_9NEOB|nr:unnamed protein product [Ranitomeya imitator]
MPRIHKQSPINTERCDNTVVGYWMDNVRSRVLHKLQVISEMGHKQHPAPENIFLAALEAGNLCLVQLLGSRHADCVLKIRGEEMGYQPQTPARFGLAGLWTLDYTQEVTSPLCITASHGYTDCVRYLLHRRADPNAAPGGRSPLHEACAGAHDACVQLLLEHGAHTNHRSDDGLTPLHLCDVKSSLSLSAQGTDRVAATVTAPLSATGPGTEYPIPWWATQRHRTRTVTPIGPNRIGDRPWVTLEKVQLHRIHEHAYEGRDERHQTITEELEEVLLQHGALVNQPTEAKQDTPLHIAARLGLLGHVGLYLRYGADINARNADGETPLILACGGKCDDEDTCLQICSLLLEKGADPEAQDEQERRPLHHACRKAEHNVMELLFKYNADVNAADYNGALPLSCVLQNAELYEDKRPHLAVRTLLNHGARGVHPEAFGKGRRREIITHSSSHLLACLSVEYNSHSPLLTLISSRAGDNDEGVLQHPALGNSANSTATSLVPVLRCCSALPELIAMLYNSYLNLQVCSKWRQDIPHDVFQAHHSFYTTFFGVSGGVRSLQHMCRFSLRKHFGSHCHLFIPLLPIPTVIKDYVLLSTEQRTSLL